MEQALVRLGGNTITGEGYTTTGGGVPHPVIEALSIGKPQISWFVSQLYRLQRTVAMASIPVMVELAVAGRR